MPLTFGNLDHPLVEGHPHVAAISAATVATWVAFARSGDPNNATIPTWRPYAPDDRATLLIDTEPTLATDPDGDERRAWGDTRSPWERSLNRPAVSQNRGRR